MSFLNKIKRFISIRLYFKKILFPKIMSRGVFLQQHEQIDTINRLLLIEKKAERLKSFHELIPVSEEKIRNRFLSSHSYQNENKYLYEISDAILAGPFGLICTGDGRLVRDAHSFNGTGRMEAFLLNSYLEEPGMVQNYFIRNPNRYNKNSSSRVETGLSMCSVWVNYFHWIIEELPKLRALELYHEETGFKPVIILPNHPAPYIKESLKAMGYDPAADAVTFHSDHLNVEKLLVQTFPEISPEMTDWMRDRVFKNLGLSGLPGNRRVYISRKKKGNRSVKNADEFEAFLKRYGFENVHLEEYSFEGQVKLLHETGVVLSAHGAGLTNVLWGNKMKVIELFGHTIKTTYARLCEACGHQYRAVAGEPIKPHHASDFLIDIDELEEILTDLGIEPIP